MTVGDNKMITIHVDIFQHQTITIENNGPLMIRIGTKEAAIEQLNDIYRQAGVKNQNYFKFCPNIAKIEKIKGVVSATAATATTTTTNPTIQSTTITQTPTQKSDIPNNGTFSIKDIKL